MRTFAILLSIGLQFLIPQGATAQALPTRISDDAFWRMVSEFSEEGGYFQFENFVSNEDAFLSVIPRLQETTKPGGVYIGVGPEQNFTYIGAVHPGIAFIVDIRRQNMLEHLVYKATFELSSDRADFLSRLFSRKRPAGLDAGSTADDLFRLFKLIEPDRAQFDATVKEVIDHLKGRGFTLTPSDEKSIAYVSEAFYKGGPDLNYGFNPGITATFGKGATMPAYWELMTARDQDGRQRSFLATEENFQFIQGMQKNNLVVPVVGDFAGSKAIRAVGEYLAGFDAKVSVFYTSNVEQYLFEEPGAWRRFYLNVAKLPLNASSTFVRSNTTGSFSPFQPPGVTGRWLSLTSSIPGLLNEVNRGGIRSYYDVFAYSK